MKPLRNIISNRRFWMLVCYAIAIVVLACFHGPWYDELQAWYITARNTPIGIFDLMKYEGHFMLWHMLLYPFAKAGISATIGLPIVSILLMILFAWLLLYKSTFNLLSCISILLSYPVLFYFPIVSRCYALIPPLIVLLAYLYPMRMTRPISYGLILGLLINTHVYIEGFTITMFVFWVIDALKDQNNKLKSPIDQKPIETNKILSSPWSGIFITFILGIFAIFQIIGNLFIENSIAGTASHIILPRDIIFNFSAQWGSLSVTIMSITGLNLIPYCYKVGMSLTMLLLISLFIWAIRGNLRSFIICIATLIFQILFSWFVYGINFQRYYIIYFVIIFCVWIVGNNGKRVAILTAVILLFGLPYELRSIQNDWEILSYYPYEKIRNKVITEDPDCDVYFNADIDAMRFVRYCYGTDTLSNLIPYRSTDALCKTICSRNANKQVIYFYYNCNPLSGERQESDIVKNKLAESGYVCTDTTPDIPGSKNLEIIRYCFRKQPIQ